MSIHMISDGFLDPNNPFFELELLLGLPIEEDVSACPELFPEQALLLQRERDLHAPLLQAYHAALTCTKEQECAAAPSLASREISPIYISAPEPLTQDDPNPVPPEVSPLHQRDEKEPLSLPEVTVVKGEVFITRLLPGQTDRFLPGQLVEALRVSRGMSRLDLGNLMDVTHGTIGVYERCNLTAAIPVNRSKELARIFELSDNHCKIFSSQKHLLLGVLNKEQECATAPSLASREISPIYISAPEPLTQDDPNLAPPEVSPLHQRDKEKPPSLPEVTVVKGEVFITRLLPGQTDRLLPGQLVEALRISRDLWRQELGNLIGVTYGTIGVYERRDLRDVIPVERSEKLAKVFGLSAKHYKIFSSEERIKLRVLNQERKASPPTLLLPQRERKRQREEERKVPSSDSALFS
jgi:transcriptional regulator with XRE-family HTH domain